MAVRRVSGNCVAIVSNRLAVARATSEVTIRSRVLGAGRAICQARKRPSTCARRSAGLRPSRAPWRSQSLSASSALWSKLLRPK